MAAIRALLFQTFGDDFELNAGATEAGADWKMTLRRPSTGMSHNLVLIMPSGDPAPGQALTVASFVGDVITMQWTSIAGGTDKIVTDTTTIAFNATSPAALFTLPANAIVKSVQVVVDEAFDGTPQLSIGITGTLSKYMGANQNDLSADAGTVFEVTPALLPVGTTENLIGTYSAGGATDGSARVLIDYVIPA
jgi:hypothetical protein